MFRSAAQRLRSLLALQVNPFEIGISGSLRVDGLAGLIRLSPEIEMQVVPKFLDSADPSWQDDFFLLASFAKTGRILPHELIGAGERTVGDLAALVAHTLIRMFEENQRHPIRTYSTQTVRDFNLDGEYDAFELAWPDPRGFEQSLRDFRRENTFNSVLAAACAVLVSEVRDPEIHKQLARIVQFFGQQPPVPANPPKLLPRRNQSWQPAYDLALYVLAGWGVGYTTDHLFAPGFILRTWPMWQSLVEAGLRAGLPGFSVLGTPQFPLGYRTRAPFDGSEQRTLHVWPDVAIVVREMPDLVVDAKYRTRGGREPSVSVDDVYESLAFMEGSNTQRTVLVYPRPASLGAPQSVGTPTLFERIQVGDKQIDGVVIELRGISGKDGFGQFSRRVADYVVQYLSAS